METPAMLRRREAETLKSTGKALNELVNHLRYMPDDIALSLLRRLRVTSDVTTVLRAIQTDLMSSRGPGSMLPPAMLNHITSGMELELMARHPFAYPSFTPGRSSLFSESFVVQAARYKVQLDRRSHEHRPGQSPLPEHSERASNQVPDALTRHGHNAVGAIGERQLTEINPRAVALPPSVPVNPDYYYDPSLAHLKIAFWTDVPVTDHWAAAAITMYLEMDHPVLGLFDPVWFVDRLVSHKIDYVTRLLVNSLLAYASVSLYVLCL